MNYKSFFKDTIEKLKKEGRYRVFVDIRRRVRKFPEADHFLATGKKQDVVVWCSNDYLGMGQNKRVIESMKRP